ncbi:MAG: SufD family Fe-S cluster assembly protein [Clostridia bacterium]|nr:SufD family Fe-S cluster assembly protein [Clostridia bacterium]
MSELLVNTLPALTWHRLGMNQSRLTLLDPNGGVWLDADVPEALTSADRAAVPALESGMGEAFSAALKEAPLFVISAPADTQCGRAAVLRYTCQEATAQRSRLYIRAEENAEFSVIVVLKGERDARGQFALGMTLDAQKGSRISLYFANLLPDGMDMAADLAGNCAENAEIVLTRLDLGSKQQHMGAAIDLAGADSRFTAELAYHARSGQALDMNYVVRHRGKRTESLITVSGVLEEAARKCFRGTIDFLNGCAGSKGTETEQVLLMGEDLVNQTIPLILCAEEDVEGNHGASIGQLDEKVLFYMASRGIGEERAKAIMARSRIELALNAFPDERVRGEIEAFLAAMEEV